MATATLTPRETDERLAELYGKVQSLHNTLAMYIESSMSMTGGKRHYINRSRYDWQDTRDTVGFTTLTPQVARERLDAILAENADESDYKLLSSWNLGQARHTVEKLDEVAAEIEAVRAEYTALEETYTGWSRFFLVTSSKGHIHSSMSCSTCRMSTTYGWLPHLSDHTEADAVEALGPSLCSVCYPTAPLEWTAEMLTKAQATKIWKES